MDTFMTPVWTHRGWIARTAGVALAALVLAACGSDGDDPVTTSADDGASGGVAAACVADAPDCNDTAGLPVDQTDRDGSVSSPPQLEPGDDVAPPDHGEPRLVTPTGNAANVRLSNWEDFLTTDDPLTYRVAFWGGVEPCHVVDRVEVTETDTSVTVALYVGSAPDAGDTACIEIAEYQAVEFTLDAPLGERTEIDAFEADEVE